MRERICISGKEGGALGQREDLSTGGGGGERHGEALGAPVPEEDESHDGCMGMSLLFFFIVDFLRV